MKPLVLLHVRGYRNFAIYRDDSTSSGFCALGGAINVMQCHKSDNLVLLRWCIRWESESRWRNCFRNAPGTALRRFIHNSCRVSLSNIEGFNKGRLMSILTRTPTARCATNAERSWIIQFALISRTLQMLLGLIMEIDRFLFYGGHWNQTDFDLFHYSIFSDIVPSNRWATKFSESNNSFYFLVLD